MQDNAVCSGVRCGFGDIHYTQVRISLRFQSVVWPPGNDTVSCQECPLGGDCSGVNIVQPSLDLADPFAAVTEPSAALVDVVQADHIVAAPGWWASQASDGLMFYKCPIIGACEVRRVQ